MARRAETKGERRQRDLIQEALEGKGIMGFTEAQRTRAARRTPAYDQRSFVDYRNGLIDSNGLKKKETKQ